MSRPVSPLDAWRAVHNCIRTPTLLYAELALQLFGAPLGTQPRAVVCGSGCKSKQPKIPCNPLQIGPPTKLIRSLAVGVFGLAHCVLGRAPELADAQGAPPGVLSLGRDCSGHGVRVTEENP